MNKTRVDPRSYRVAPSNRAVRGGDPVVVLPVEDVLADSALLELPTVRRVARAGLRGVVLVPFEEFAGAFPAATRGGVVAAK